MLGLKDTADDNSIYSNNNKVTKQTTYILLL